MVIQPDSWRRIGKAVRWVERQAPTRGGRRTFLGNEIRYFAKLGAWSEEDEAYAAVDIDWSDLSSGGSVDWKLRELNGQSELPAGTIVEVLHESPDEGVWYFLASQQSALIYGKVITENIEQGAKGEVKVWHWNDGNEEYDESEITLEDVYAPPLMLDGEELEVGTWVRVDLDGDRWVIVGAACAPEE